jgi:hypothetical protein
VDVGVGVGDNENIAASINGGGQILLDVGVTVTVGVTVIVGVTVGVSGKSQSNKTEKSNELQLFVGDGVGVGQTPELKNSSHKSGQVVEQGDLPDK